MRRGRETTDGESALGFAFERLPKWTLFAISGGAPSLRSAIRNFRLFAIAQGISMCGTWMQAVAQGLLVLDLTGSGTALGLVIALQTLPILMLGPWGGVIADRFPKRKILYLTQTAVRNPRPDRRRAGDRRLDPALDGLCHRACCLG